MMSAQPSISKALEAASAGNTKTAIVILRDIIKQNPRDVDAWLALADIVEKPEQAAHCLERVLQIDPDNQIAKQRLFGEQPDDLGFLFETADEPVQEPDNEQMEVPDLDFSHLYTQKEQPAQTESVQSQPEIENPPQIPPPAPNIDQTNQQPQPRPKPAANQPVKKKKKGLGALEIILIVVIVFICLCLGVFAIISLGNGNILNQEPTDLPDEVTAVIYENIRASNAKDFNRYMGTIHADSPGYNTTKETIEQAFSDEFTLSYRVTDVYIIEQDKDEAKVHFVLTTKLVSGPISFRDNQVTGEMILRKENGDWKIYNQNIADVEYLD